MHAEEAPAALAVKGRLAALAVRAALAARQALGVQEAQEVLGDVRVSATWRNRAVEICW
jgi:hypothetical protein